MKTYVIVECEELNDQFECDANRTPIQVLVNANSNELRKFQYFGYEIYVALEDGTLKKIQEYDDYQTEED